MIGEKTSLKVLITVKTYPIPSAKYDELVCTAGVKEDGDFVRLYPINFRDLPYSKQYRKYQWIEVMASKHVGRDSRKESYRPDCDTLITLGDPIPPNPGNWSERAKYVLKNRAQSIEDLREQQSRDKTSLGIFKPKKIHNLVVTPDHPEWKESFKRELLQARIWEDRTVSKEPPRKVPFKFQYLFECDDSRCRGKHRVMIEDWEVGALFWRLVDKGATHQEAAHSVRDKFLHELCGADKDTHFYVGTILNYSRTWVIIGMFYPRIAPDLELPGTPSLFDSI